MESLPKAPNNYFVHNERVVGSGPGKMGIKNGFGDLQNWAKLVDA